MADEAPERSGDYVLFTQLADEFADRYRAGQRPPLQEYIDRCPALADDIRELFPAMVEMEQAKEARALFAEPTCQAPQPPPFTQLGDFRIIREVGKGGMGVVYEAEQLSLGRHVALKVLPRGMLPDGKARLRFEREAKAAARLHHTNIVPVFGVGEQDGLPYYVMQFIQGLGLDEVLDELKKLQPGSGPTGSSGDGRRRSARHDVSAEQAAQSLLRGEFPGAPHATASLRDEPAPVPEATPEAPEASLPSSSSVLRHSSSSLVLPGRAGSGSSSRHRKATYWQSVAQIGVQVAQALEYAHKQGVLHRDIKPSNLLLDMQGTVWVTDFGLAKADDQQNLTHTGDIMGTLRYMPPEAFDGKSDARGDIYSLGLTLYEILTFRPAFEAHDRNRLIKRVTHEDPVPLRKVNRQVPQDLETIVHKAIDKDPARRYASAAALAEDLQRFIDDEPIRARPVSAVERGWRWCRHHPGVAGLTATLALLLVAVTIASVGAAARFEKLARQQTAAAEREGLARREAVEARELEAKLRKEAEAATQHAEAARQQAEAATRQVEVNFARARKAVDDYFTTVSESQLLTVPGMQPLRRDLLQSALAFYQDILKERGDDPALRGELAATHLRVGKLRKELGLNAEAVKNYKQARTLYQALVKAEPTSVEWRHGLAQCNFALGRADEAIALWEQLVQPGEPRYQKELADAYNQRAYRHLRAGRVADALEADEQALAIRERLVRRDPDDAAAQHALGQSLNNIGMQLAQTGQVAEALPVLRRVTEHAEIAFARAPQIIIHGRLLALSQANIARMERRLGHLQEALLAYRRAADVWRKLARDNPAVPEPHSRVFRAYRDLAQCQRDLQQPDEAERSLRLARAVIDWLPADTPLDLYNLACYHALCAAAPNEGPEQAPAEELAERQREQDLALAALHRAVAAGYRNLPQLREDESLDAVRGREEFKALMADLARRPAATPADRLKAKQEALTFWQKLIEREPGSRQLRADLAAGRHAMGLIQLDLGNADDAGRHLEEAVALRAKLAQDEPSNAQYQTDLALSRCALGDVHWRSGRLADGVKEWQRSLEALPAARSGPPRASLATQLLRMHRTITGNYARAGLWTEAAVQADRLIRLEGATAADYYDRACLALLAGDAAGYRRCVSAMVARFGGAAESGPGTMGVWAASLTDNSDADRAQLLKWAEKRAVATRIQELRASHVFGLAQYRAGKFAEAIAEARAPRAPRPSDASWPIALMNEPVLAMAHHRLGQTTEARRLLNLSVQRWRRLSPVLRISGGPTILPSTHVHWRTGRNWQDWAAFEILLREASLLIAGVPLAADAFYHAHRSLLYRQLGEDGKAVAEWQTAIKAAPREPALWLARGRRLAELKRPDAAAADFAKTLALLPPDPIRRDVYAELDRAEPLLSKVMAMRPKDAALAAFVRARSANAQDSRPAGIVASGNLLKNGSFEQGPQVRGQQIFRAGSAALPGWTIARGSVGVGGMPWCAPAHGQHCLQLNGAVRQSVATQGGHKYRLTFDLAGNPRGPVAAKKLRIQAADQSADFTFDTTGRIPTTVGWVGKMWEFTAGASQTTVELLSLNPEGTTGPLLDNIALVPVHAAEKKQ